MEKNKEKKEGEKGEKKRWKRKEKGENVNRGTEPQPNPSYDAR